MIATENNAKKIVDSYIELFKHLNKNAGILEPKLGLNKNWSKITDSLDIIYCGDNPGTKELESQEYFIGDAGIELMHFVTLTNKVFENKESVFFNKTPYSSARTNDIRPNDDPDQIIKKSIILTINCLYKLWKKNREIKLFIFGHSSSYIVRIFRKFLKIKVQNNPDFAKKH